MFGVQNVHPIEMVRGNTRNLPFALIRDDKEPFLLGDGDFIRFVVKAAYYKEPLIDKRAGKDAQDANGVCTVILKPADTSSLDVSEYQYDLGIQIGDDFYTIITESPFKLIANYASFEVLT